MLLPASKKRLLITAFGCVLAWNTVESQQPLPAPGAGVAFSLRAVRKGAKVELAWARRPGAADSSSQKKRLVLATICRTISPTLLVDSGQQASCREPVGRVSLRDSTARLSNTAYEKKNAKSTSHFTDRLPDGLQRSESLQFAIYTVEVVDDHGQRAGASNRAGVLLTPTPLVQGLHSQLDSRGVYLIWEDDIGIHPEGVEVDYRIARREKTSMRSMTVPYLRAVVHLKEGDRWTGIDPNPEWGTSYIYSITPFARYRSPDGNVLAEMEGEESAPLEVITHDVFPPAVPERLLVLVSSPPRKFVDLTWAPNVDKDLAGYRVYRRETDGASSLIHKGAPSLVSFQDTDVSSGRTYFYCLSAVDAAGNESAKSIEVPARVP